MTKGKPIASITIDVEDWFHILDSSKVPPIDTWDSLPLRVERGMKAIFELMDESGSKATFFWLGWMAERFPDLVRECVRRGHEVASHGYAHVLAFEVGREAFKEDILQAKHVLEHIAGEPVSGVRAPGFSVTEGTPWAFEVIRSCGYTYDSSVFPASRAHGGLVNAGLGPEIIATSHGPLKEIPATVVKLYGHRVSLFGGGYLRLAPLSLIRHGIRVVARDDRPIVFYVHPRELDPDHPRLPLGSLRNFKSYFNLHSTLPKLKWVCQSCELLTMKQLADSLSPGENEHVLS